MCKVNCGQETSLERWQDIASESGQGLETAEKALRKAIEGGDQDKIMLAQMDYDKQSRVFEMIQQLWKSMQEQIMRIIQNIGGR